MNNEMKKYHQPYIRNIMRITIHNLNLTNYYHVKSNLPYKVLIFHHFREFMRNRQFLVPPPRKVYSKAYIQMFEITNLNNFTKIKYI